MVVVDEELPDNPPHQSCVGRLTKQCTVDVVHLRKRLKTELGLFASYFVSAPILGMVTVSLVD